MAQKRLMKADSTVDKVLRKIRRQFEESSDPIERRVAWAIYHAMYWARKDTSGWPDPTKDAAMTAALIRENLKPRPLAHGDTGEM